MTDHTNTDGGYTRAYRRMWDHPMFRSKQEAAVFAWMVSAASWRGGRVSTKYGPADLEVGELLISERELADDFGMHRNTVRALIQRMFDDGAISLFRDRCPHRAGTIVRINKYKEYQHISEQLPAHQDRNGTEVETLTGPNQDRTRTKIKEGKEGKKDSVAEATGVGTPDLFGTPPVPAPLDLKAQVWATGVAYLVGPGATSEPKARSLIGKWRRDFQDVDIINALAAAQAEAASEPVSFVEACLARSKKNGTGTRTRDTTRDVAGNPFAPTAVGGARVAGGMAGDGTGPIIDHEPQRRDPER